MDSQIVTNISTSSRKTFPDLDATDFHILKPSDFLRTILRSDNELKNLFLEWTADIRDYRQRSAEQMEEFEKTIRKWNNRQRVS